MITQVDTQIFKASIKCPLHYCDPFSVCVHALPCFAAHKHMLCENAPVCVVAASPV